MSDSKTTDEEVSENVRLLLAHYHRSEQARLEQAKAKLRAEILPALAQHRVANVEAAYSGYGDSGAIDGVQYRDKSGVLVERERKDPGHAYDLNRQGSSRAVHRRAARPRRPRPDSHRG